MKLKNGLTICHYPLRIFIVMISWINAINLSPERIEQVQQVVGN